MSEAVAALEGMLDRLDGPGGEEVGDAIDRVRASAVRTTNVRSLRRDPVMEQFRKELSDGLIRADTVRQVLELVSMALDARSP